MSDSVVGVIVFIAAVIFVLVVIGGGVLIVSQFGKPHPHA